ncbi:MAG: metal-dependent hydrolase [Candidatus Shapirobacteria bacterium]|jgi:inner membrane protein
MTSKTHDLFAFASLLTLATRYPPSSLNFPTFVVSLISNIVGALLPDLDQASNRLWDLLPAGNFLGRFLRRLFLSHRTISHSLLGIYLIHHLLLFLLPQLLNSTFLDLKIIYFSIMTGFISHLILDFFTEEGVPLLFPLKFKFGFPPISSWRIKTGKWFEKHVVVFLIIIYIILMTITNWPLLIRHLTVSPV